MAPGLDWRAMVKDRRFQLAAAVVGGAGVITLVRRKQSAAGDAAAGATAGGTGSAASGYQGPGNTTGTDIAGFLSNYSSLLDGRLSEFGANQDAILAAINAGQGTPTTGTPAPALGTVKAGFNLETWIRDFNAGGYAPGVTLTRDSLFALNPGIEGNISNGKFITAASYRVS